jgi:hypothetical protein
VIYRLILVTEQGRAILTEDGELLIIEERRLITGGGGGFAPPGRGKSKPKARPAWRPSMPLIPRVDVEEDEALLLCGAL